MINKKSVLAHRMLRQGLTQPARSEREYLVLVRRLQPIAPIANTMPGDPPKLVHRTSFDNGALAAELRGRRALLKGRFWGGNIGYVLAGDLALYGAAFRRPIDRLNPIQEQLLEALRYAGELSARQLREETGLKNKQIMPALHRLQQAFAVFEDQEDSSWSRPWSLMERAWPEIDLQAIGWEEAAGEVIGHFLQGQVFATFSQIRDWSRFAVRRLKGVMGKLEENGAAIPVQIEGLGEGWMPAEDRNLEKREAERKTFMLHRADPLIQPRASELKERFKDREVLQYLLVDGEIRGAVCGHWRIGPHDVEDIVLDLADEESKARKEEIVAEVARSYQPPRHSIRRYAGEKL